MKMTKAAALVLAALCVAGGVPASFGRLETGRGLVGQESFAQLEEQFRAALEGKEFKKLGPISMKLAKTKNPAAIVLMIGAIDAEGTLETIYNIGFFGLGAMTGVEYSESHNGPWWKSWWESNKSKYPADIQKMPYPSFKGFVERPSIQIPNDTDVADIPSVARFANGNKNMIYFLSGDTARVPEAGAGLLVVLPGGDGGAGFHPFIKRIQKRALNGYLVAQPVAPVWYPGQGSEIVWPTSKATVRDMKFPTEEFIEAVIADVKKVAKVNPKRIFTLGWSSSGPALYEHIVQKSKSIAGSFVAMSVFKPNQMSPVENVDGFPVYILHSPEDFIPIRMAEEAKSTLTSKGAVVGYATYPGGHGWRGDVFGMIRQGIEFLEKNAK